MSVQTPPRPPPTGDPVDDSLVQALIEEARRRARRRRRIYAVVAVWAAVAGAALFTILGRTAQSQTASSAASSRFGSSLASATPRLAFASSPRGSKSDAIYVINADGSERRRVTTYGGWGSDLAWSPDGQELAFTRGYPWSADIYLARADGSGERRLTRTPELEGAPTWSPDGRKIAFTRIDRWNDPTTDLYVMNADGSSARLLSRNARRALWSPDGQRLVFTGGAGPGGANIDVINADGSGRRSVARLAADEDSLSWSPDGRRIALVKHPDCTRCSPIDVAGMGNPNTELWVMGADGSGKHRVASGHGMSRPSWSPDGATLVYQSFYRPRPNTPGLRFLKVNELFLVGADGSGKRRLAQGGQPLWSPDGKQIAFIRWPRGAADLYVMNADGSGQRRLTSTPSYGEITYAWSGVK
jgi:Tol biopolymer transport system component